MIKRLFAFTTLMMAVTSLSAQEPIEHLNMHVFSHATPESCTATWSGSGGELAVDVLSGYGMNNSEAPGVMSCNGCAIDSSSQDCVCKVCYEYYN